MKDPTVPKPTVSAIVPIKLHSRRLPNKNFLNLNGKPLCAYIFESLLEVEGIDNTYCYSSSSAYMHLFDDKVSHLNRPSYLDSDTTKARQLFDYAINSIQTDIIIIAHATSPFIASSSIKKGLDCVLNGDFRSSHAVLQFQKYSWYEGKPLNFNISDLVQTQDLQSVLVETSGFYVFHKTDYLNSFSRISYISNNPIPISLKESIDIDTPEDFQNALELSSNYNSYTHRQNEYFVNLISKLNQNNDSSISHICFDLDGVLLDSFLVMRQAWEYVVNKYNLNIPFENYKQFIGMPFFDILDNLCIDPSIWEVISDLYNEQSLLLIDNCLLYPNVSDVLRSLISNGYTLTLCTSKSLSRTKKILIHHNIYSYFSHIEAAPDNLSPPNNKYRGKPAPDGLLKCCIEVGNDPCNSVYIGDTINDMKAASRANFNFIYAHWGIDQKLLLEKTIWIESIVDLLNFFPPISHIHE